MNDEIKETGAQTDAPEEIADEQADMEEQLEADADAARRDELKKTVKKEIREWAVALVTALVVVLVVRTFLFTVIRVDGNSMYPTLLNNERLLVTVFDAKMGNIDRGDVVICNYPGRGSDYFVKRVVAVEGDVVQRIQGITFVNGQPLDPAGLVYEIGYDYEPYTLGEDEYFCVGANRYDRHDSRDWNAGDPSRDVGPLDVDMIKGKVRFVFWPLSEFRAVE